MSAPASAGGRRRLGPTFWALLLTSLASFMGALDNLVVTTALPAIRDDLGGGMEDLEWTVSAYTLTFAVLLMLGASLGDRFGRRRMFAVGIGIFTASSAAAALSTGIEGLVAARAVQGVGAALLMPLSLTLLSAAVPAARRGMALGVWGAVQGLAVASGPLVGGALTEHISWHWIFWLNVPVGIALIPLVRLKLAESHGPNDRLDIPGTVLASTALFGLIYALVRGNADGWTATPVLAGLIAAPVLLTAFVAYELRAANPMLPMRLFRNRSFSAVNAASVLMFVGMFGSIFLLSQFLQGVGGYSPLEAGLRMLPWTAMPLIVTPIAGALSDRIGGRPIIAAGLALQAVGLVLWAVAVEVGFSYGSILPALTVSGVGMAMYFAPSANVVLSSVAPEEQGIASGANNALRELGGALGIALLAAVFSAQGGYETGQSFVDGLTPALWVGAAGVGLGALLALLIHKHRGPATAAPLAASKEDRTPVGV
ncbi:DHA2 family efflux MFS transporter permease subunit [Streptomyces sp. NBC_01808]|uniref:DHA2 family efflux MFS transporter permease subunit n=1 Tax=Streptomyces sp. NBC_01808 TaxID=2975947 RepID=UPI002DD93D4A|nr:DHA2 family efflux MFS transporter permease subunit [Streptomyces sp. NBC_01808]WSA39819.1 DHA2 family efflux MFS transporter permease subunit [Streptomyces sp. NBC_01808]